MKLNLDKKVYDLLREHPDLQDFLISIGFENFKNLSAIESITKIMTLRKILQSRSIDGENFQERFAAFAASGEGQPAVALDDANLVVRGALPCPVKDTMIEAYHKHIDESELKVYSDFKSANLGYDFVGKTDFTIADLPDVFLSPGFKFPFLEPNIKPLFNGENFMESDLPYNSAFDAFKDPKRIFHIAGAVPCVFLINKTGHDFGEYPSSWSDIVDPDFDVELTLPMGDLDIVNAVLLTIHSTYGEKGVEVLLSKCTRNMHPSEMVKTMLQNKVKTSVNIIPYFFGTMAERNGNVKVVWPEDGAILSPILMAFKKHKQAQLSPLIDYFNSPDFAKSMYADGKFPSSFAGIDNDLPGGFKWVGWDYLYSDKSAVLLEKYEDLLK